VDAWQQVGIRVAGLQPAGFAPAAEGSLEGLREQIEKLSADVRVLIKEVRGETQTKAKVTDGRAGSRRKVKPS
jgi:hypothetical protein